MSSIKLLNTQIIFFLAVLSMIACNKTYKNEQINKGEKENVRIDRNMTVQKSSLFNDQNLIDTLEIMVVQCANGYEYAIHNYDFNPVIENELNKFDNIIVKPFPLKVLKGVVYQGVFDKKYCHPIIDKVNVDFLILSRFDKKYGGLNQTEMKWGYELRIVNTETLEQINSINAHNLNSFQEIEKHIKDNIGILKADIEKLKKSLI